MGGNCSNHLPSVFAVVLKFLPLNFILTFSFLEAHPQTFILASLCKIILSLISRGSLTWAVSTCIITKKKQTAVVFFIFNPFVTTFVSIVILYELCDYVLLRKRGHEVHKDPQRALRI